MATIGFIILRHVNNKETSIYWKKCYESIRRFYKENQIMIIDDNSNYEYILYGDYQPICPAFSQSLQLS